MKRYLTIFVALFIFIIRVNAEDYETGELIKYKGIKFYVIEDKGDYLTLLKATPLKLDELKQYTDHTTTGFPEDYYMGSLPYCKGEEEKCTFEDSNVKAALDSWSKQFGDNDLVADEVTYKEYDNNSGHTVKKSHKVRLLTEDELIKKFGYTLSTYSTYSSLKTPKWITNYDYFLMDYIDNYVYNSHSYYYTVSEGYYSSSFSGSGIDLTTRQESSLRPVINLSKKADIEKLKSPVKSITASEFKVGDIVEYNDVEYYVIKDSTKNDKTVTMIKAMPLTKKEVEKYDSKYTSIGTQYDIYDDENNSVDIYKYIPYYYRSDSCIDSTISNGCKNDYESSDVKQIVDKWSDEHVKSSDLAKDETGYAVRIISVKDLTDNLGYASTVSISTIGDNYNAEIKQLHQAEGLSFNLTYCWTMTPVDDTKEYEYKINIFDVNSRHVGGEESSRNDFRKNTQGLVCPVITVNKKIASQENNSSNNAINIPDTLLKNPVFIVVVGIILIVIATVTVSLILKRKK